MDFKDKLQEDVIKIIVIGDKTVGKTSFVQRYVYNHYIENYKCTIGVDFEKKQLHEHGGKRVNLRLQFWDIAGQERYTLLTRSFYKYARGCIIMFDLNNSDSFENVRKWCKAVESSTDAVDSSIPCLLVANKLDLLPRMVSDAQIEQMCQEFNFIQWTQTSVKDGINVHEAVNYLLDVILNKSLKTYVPSDYEFIDTVDLVGYEDIPRKKSCRPCH